MRLEGVPSWVVPYLGLPFRYQGRTRDGVDCWGLVRLVLQEQFRIEMPSFAESACYAHQRPESAFGRLPLRRIGGEITAQAEVWRRTWQKQREAQPGDVVVLRHAGIPSHVGLMVTPEIFLHIEEEIRSVCESCTDRLWRHRVDGFYRHAASVSSSRVLPASVSG